MIRPRLPHSPRPLATPALLSALLATCGLAHADDGASFGIGADYSRGDYGTGLDTGILSIPVSARVRSGNWTFGASVPWLRVSGDPNVLPTTGPVDNLNPLGRGRDGLLGGGSSEDADGGLQRGTASGIGDVTLAATYAVPTGSALGVELGASAKIATADEDKGLGTGANDYGVSVGLHRDFDGTMLFGGVGHTWLGDSTWIDVDSVVGGNLGVSRQAGRGRLGAMLEHRSASAEGLDDRRDAVGFYTLPTDAGGSVQLYAGRGLSDGSPDWSAGISIRSGF